MRIALQKLFGTEKDLTGLVIRVTLGLVMFPHGAQKLFGWFGGYGFNGTMGYFTQNGLPWIVAFLVIMAESLGAAALIVGFFSRFSAFGIGLVMLGAIFMYHLKFGFFMNWFGAAQGEGYEYHILAIGLAIGVMIKGGGSLSVDRPVARWLNGGKN